MHIALDRLANHTDPPGITTLMPLDTGIPCSDPPAQAAAFASHASAMATARPPSSPEAASLAAVAEAAVRRELSHMTPHALLDAPFTPAEVEMGLSALR